MKGSDFGFSGLFTFVYRVLVPLALVGAVAVLGVLGLLGYLAYEHVSIAVH